jgi:hypothetical protein
MSAITDEQVAEFLAMCSPSRLSLLLIPVLASHTERDDILERRLALCEFRRTDQPSPDGSPWSIEVIAAPPDPSEWTAFETQDYWETGFCGRCRVKVASYAKLGVCPLCDAIVELT